MKCYWVMDLAGECQQILFAENKWMAVQQSDVYQNDGDFIGVRALRKKEWDQYSELGHVPKEVLIESGWWFECSGYLQNPRRRCCRYTTQDDKYTVIDNRVYCEECAKAIEVAV